MKEFPIIFSASMITTTLDGRKTTTACGHKVYLNEQGDRNALFL